jgi:DNA-binding MarR family transcriptional regulator
MDKQLVREFRKNLRRLEQLIVTQLREDTCCHGVSVAQCHCLLAVEQLRRPSQNELAEQLCLDKSTLSRTVEGLVQIGQLARATDERDRRVYRIRLTEQGEKTCSAINAANDELYGRVLDRLPMPVERVVSSFATIVQAIVEVKDEDGFCLSAVCTQKNEVKP